MKKLIYLIVILISNYSFSQGQLWEVNNTLYNHTLLFSLDDDTITIDGMEIMKLPLLEFSMKVKMAN